MAVDHQLQVWLTDAYGFPRTPNLELLQRSTAIQVVRVSVKHQIYWLRLYGENDASLEQVEAEARAIEQLHQHGVKVAAPLYRQDGRLVGRFRDGLAVLFANAAGIVVKTPTPEQAAAFGALVARIHSCGHAITLLSRPVINYRLLVEQPLIWVEPYLAEWRAALKELRLIAQHMREQVWPDGSETELPSGFCHGDIHLENVKFWGTSPTIFDFAACAIGPYAYDLACYWRQQLLASRDELSAEPEWDAFIQGYQAIRSLQPQELKAIPALATLRAIWVMALPAQPGAMWGTDWCTDRSYFNAHFKMIQDFARRAAKGGYDSL